MAATMLSAFAATTSARSSDIRPAIGSSTSASSLPFATTDDAAADLAAGGSRPAPCRRLLVPTTIMWWLSCATVEATAQSTL